MRAFTDMSIHLEREEDDRVVIPEIKTSEGGHPGTAGHAFWLKITTTHGNIDFCFGEDKMAMDRFASAISEAVTAFVG